MAEFKRTVPGPNLNIPSVTATKPVDTRAAEFQFLAQAGKIALKAGGTAFARSAGEEIRGEGEAAVSVDNEVTGLEFDLALSDVGVDKPLNQAQLQDFRARKFDEVLSNQKRIQSALSRGMISSTEANARMATLRNEALSNPIIAMFQDSLDDAMFTTTGGSKGKAPVFFGATTAEQEAAASRKGHLKAIEEREKEVTTVASELGVSTNAAESIIAEKANIKNRLQELDFRQKNLSFNSQNSAAMADTHITDSISGFLGVVKRFIAVKKDTGTGGRSEDIQSSELEMDALGHTLLLQIEKGKRDKEGRLVMTSEAFNKAKNEVVDLVKSMKLMLTDQASFKRMDDIFKGRASAQALEKQEVQLKMFREAPVLMSLGGENSAMQEALLESMMGHDDVSLKFAAATNPLVRAALNVQDELSDRSLSSATDKFVKPQTADVEGSKLSDEESARFSVLFMSKRGPGSIIEAYKAGKATPAELDAKAAALPINARDLANNRGWMGSINGSKEAARAIASVIEGIGSRAIIDQFSNSVTTERGARGGRGGTIGAVTKASGLPSTLSVSVKKTGRARTTRSIMIDTGGVKVTDAYKSAVLNVFNIGNSHPSIWNEDFDSVDDWLTQLFTREEAPPKGLTEETAAEVRDIRGFDEKVEALLNDPDITEDQKSKVLEMQERFR